MLVYKKLHIYNFLSFYDSTEIQFDPKSNIFIGRNESGKSKIFDVFLWLIKNEICYNKVNKQVDKVYDSNHENVLYAPLLNHKALDECEKGEEVTVECILSFSHTDKEYRGDSLQYKYELSKSVTFKKDFNGNLKYLKNRAELILKDPNTGNVTPFNGLPSIREELRTLLKEDLYNYIFFQGERREKLLDINVSKKTNFSKALNDISDIKTYKKAQEKIKEAKKTLSKEIRESNTKDSESKKELDVILSEISELEKKIEENNSKLSGEFSKKKTASDLYKKRKAQLSKYRGLDKLIQKLDIADRNKNIYNNNLSDLYEELPNKIFDTWLLDSKDYVEIFESYEKICKNSQEKGDEYPPFIKEADCDEILENKKCKLCEHEFEEGDKHYNAIEKWKKLSSESYGNEFSELETLRDFAKERIQSISETKNEKQAYTNKVKAIQKKLKTIQTEIDDINSKIKKETPPNVEIKDLDIDELKESMKNARKELEDAGKNIQSLENMIEYLEGNLKGKKTERNKIQKVSGDNINIEIQNIIDDVDIKATELLEIFQENMIEDIEEFANKSYKSMLSNSLGTVATLKIENKSINAYDKNGILLQNENTGNLVIKDLAFMCGIIDAANAYNHTELPFVADAPTSDLDGLNLLSVLKSIPEVFGQTIIFVKPEGLDGDKAVIKFCEKLRENSSANKIYHIKKIKKDNARAQHTELVEL